jgi:hypothetical protein
VVGILVSDDAQCSWFLLVRILRLPFVIWKSLLLMFKLSLVEACSSCDSVSLCQQSWESNSHLTSSGQSTVCRQALPLQGRCTGIWHSDLPPGWRWMLKTGPVSEAVLLRPVTEAVSFCSPHSHLHRLVSVGSGNQDGSPRCFCKPLQGRADTSPLAGWTPLLWQGRCLDVWSR